MLRFLYKAKNDKGQVVTGTVRAKDEIDAERILSEHNLKPIDLLPDRTPDKVENGRASSKEKAIFARQLATMISSGMPLPKSIKIVSTQTEKPFLKNVYLDIYSDLEEGYTFSTALARHPKIFDKVFVSIVAAGETTGKLDVVLNQLAGQLENDNNFTSKIRGAFYYPGFILVALIGIAIYMLTAVIPQLTSIFDSMGANLPMATKVLIAMAGFTRNYWWLLIVVVVGGGLFLKYWVESKSGSHVIDTLKLKLPGLNKLFEGVYMYRFTKVMSMLISAGVPLLDALKVGGTVIGNTLYEESILDVISHIEKGVPLSVQLSKDPLFPSMVGQMAAVGEETGELDKVLNKVSEYYGDSTDQAIKNISSLVEPAVLVIMGLAVAFMVFAVLVPIYNVANLQ